MLYLQRITDYPLQFHTPALDSGAIFSLELYYRPIQQGWFINSLTYGDFTLTGMRVVNSPNMLNQWRNKLPFGLACFTTGNREPMLQSDFVTQTAKLYVLTEAEVIEFAEYLTLG